MGRLSSLFLGMLIGGAAVWGGFNYHLLRTSSGFHLVRKQSASLSELYVDIRSFGVSDWSAHPVLAADLTASGKAGLMGSEANSWLQGNLERTFAPVKR